MTAAAIVARNAQIAEMREVERMMWEDIAAHFKIDVKTAKRGYDDHIEGRQHAVDFEQAMKDMRVYVAVLVRNQQVLARIAHQLPEPGVNQDAMNTEPTKEVERVEVRARIAAMHEQVDQMFKEIAVRQAIGDLPIRFSELVADRDWVYAFEQAMGVLKEHGVPRQVFLDIAKAMKSRIDAPVPKTYPSVV